MPRWPSSASALRCRRVARSAARLSVGHSGIRRLGYGPVRDVLLQACYVSDRGEVVKAGGPTVKNVSGFDLCRLLVGARGTLGFLGDVILRTRPRPQHSQWFTAEADDPFPIFTRLYRPTSVLWNGSQLWASARRPCRRCRRTSRRPARCAECDGPPPLPSGSRRVVAPSAVGALTGDIRGRGRRRHRSPRRPTARQADSRIVSDETDPAHQGRVRPRRTAQPRCHHRPELPFVAAPPGTLESVTSSARTGGTSIGVSPSLDLLRMGMNGDLHRRRRRAAACRHPDGPRRAGDLAWRSFLTRIGLRVPTYVRDEPFVTGDHAVFAIAVVDDAGTGRLGSRRRDGRRPASHRHRRLPGRLSAAVLRRLPVVELRVAARPRSAATSMTVRVPLDRRGDRSESAGA